MATAPRRLTFDTYHGPDRSDKRAISPHLLPVPSVAIRCHCLECVGFVPKDVRACTGVILFGDHGRKMCHLHPFRKGHGKGSRLRAIHNECVRCMGNSPRLVAGCVSPRCALFPFRLGHHPGRSRHALAIPSPSGATWRGKRRPRSDETAHVDPEHQLDERPNGQFDR